MKRLAAILATLMATSCASTGHVVEVAATKQALDSIGRRDWVVVRLKDTTELRINDPRDFGYAWCGDKGCVRESDIATISYFGESLDIGQTLVNVTFGPPVVAVLVGALVIHCGLDCIVGRETATVQEPRKLTDTERSRIWLDGLIVKDDKLIGTRTQWDNPCKLQYGATPARMFTGDASALETIWASRHLESYDCLLSVAEAFRLQGGAVARERAMRLWSLGRVKKVWHEQRCLWTGTTEFRPTFPMVPPKLFDTAERKGDPAILRIIEETLTDEQSYIDSGDLDRTCRTGVRPESEWPAAKARVMNAGPYPRAERPAG